jgi:two-component system, cell cycle sensor histidine kinase and response regulator CckA
MSNDERIEGTVLIVDDDPRNLKVLNSLLRNAGFQVLLAKDGAQCLESAELGRPDLILLDIVMTEMDGYETCRRLKAGPKTADIPVIFISALAEQDNILQGFDAGGVDYVAKPFQREEVLARVMAHVTIQRQKNELCACTLGLEAKIKETEKMAASLERSERRLNEAQVLAGLGNWERDLATGESNWSDNQYRLFGYEPGEEKGDYDLFKKHVHPEDLDRVVKAIEDCIRIGRPYEIEYRYLPLNGEVRYAHAVDEIEFDQTGRPTRILGTFQDITERKKTEEERLRMERRLQTARRLESLGILAGGIAHDFNNLLYVVLGNLDMAREDVPEYSEAHRFLEESEKAAQRAVHLVRQMLAYSGKGQFLVSHIDIGDLIRDNVRELQIAVSGKARLTLDLAPDLPPVKGDARQLLQLLTNLVINAAEACEQDGGNVAIATSARTCDRGYMSETIPDIFISSEAPLAPAPFVVIDVTDDGPGMGPDTKKRIFEPFFTTKFQGRGLGLAAAMGIVRGHGGYIRVDSEPGRGSVFRVLLPALTETP